MESDCYYGLWDEVASRMLVLQHGRIEQDSIPAELMKVDGYFRDMMIRGGESPA